MWIRCPELRHDLAQPVAGPERFLRERRHLHQVHVEVQQAGVIPRRRHRVEGRFQKPHALVGPGALGRPPRGQIPHLPRRLVHDRLGEHRADLQILRVGLEHLAHFGGEGLVPGRHVVQRLALRVARLERMDQGVLDRTGLVGVLQRLLQRVIGRGQRHLPPLRIVTVPGQIVVGAGRVADTPVRKGAEGIVLQRLPEAFDGFAVVEAEQPIEATIGPDLSFGRRGGDGATIGAEIEIFHEYLQRRIFTDIPQLAVTQDYAPRRASATVTAAIVALDAPAGAVAIVTPDVR